MPKRKKWDGVVKAKMGEGTRIVGIAESYGLALVVGFASASPYEVTLVEAALRRSVQTIRPGRSPASVLSPTAEDRTIICLVWEIPSIGGPL